jgi:serine/threonine protein kinase
MKMLGEITYERQKQIGVGQGMNSTVWLAHDPQLGGAIAVKEIDKTKLGNDVAAFFKEANAMFAADHPNVVPIRAAWQTNDLICLGMNYFQNGSLQDRMTTAPIGLRDALRVGHGILTGLGHIHSKDYIHFDIKPSNVLFADNGEPMIADFGQTRKFTSPTGIVIPRPAMYAYGIPPECYHGVGIVQSDIYQVGLTLYRALNGDPFFKAQVPATDAEIKTRTFAGGFPSRTKFMPHVPTRLRTIVRKALEVKPTDRYADAVSFATALAGVSIGLDWHTTVAPNGDIEWKASRLDQPEIIISAHQEGGGCWKAEMFTRKPGAAPRRRKPAEWRKNKTWNQLVDYLKPIFDELE